MAKMGAPEGNQNARKHGFYSRRLTETEKLDLEDAEKIEGLDDEIAILRVKLGSLLENQPERVDLQLKAISIISRLVKTRHSITPEDQKRLKNAIGNVLRDVAIPLGIKFIPIPADEILPSDPVVGPEDGLVQ